MGSKSKLGHVVVVVTLCVLLLTAASGQLPVFCVCACVRVCVCENHFSSLSVLADCETGHHRCLNAKAGSFLKDSRKVRALTFSALLPLK